MDKAKKVERQLLEKVDNVGAELFFVLVALLGAGFIVKLLLTDGWWPGKIISLAVSGVCTFLMVFQTGGSRYEIWGDKLVVRFGLFRIAARKIPLKNIKEMNIDEYSGIAPKEFVGYFSFKDKTVVIDTDTRRYILNSSHPEKLITQIETFREKCLETNQ